MFKDLLMPGATFADYEIQLHLGRGGFADVYLAEHKYLHDRVALKVARQTGEFNQEELEELFKKESLAFGQLRRARHKNLIRIDYAGLYENRPFLSMDYVHGFDLRELMDSRSLADKFSIRIVSDFASGLEAIHKCGIVHKDITPNNIRLTTMGVPKIIDFGIAEFLSESMGDDEYFMGTLPYVAPECAASSPIDCRADIFSLGRILYECLVPKDRWSRFSLESIENKLLRHLQFQMAPPENCIGMYPEVYPILKKMIDNDPNNRYDSAQEVCENLREVLQRNSDDLTCKSDFDSFIEDLGTPSAIDIGLMKAPFFLIKPEKYARIVKVPSLHESLDHLPDVLYPKQESTQNSFYRFGHSDDKDIILGKAKTAVSASAIFVPEYSIDSKSFFRIICDDYESVISVNGKEHKQTFIKTGDLLDFGGGAIYTFTLASDLGEALNRIHDSVETKANS